MYFSNKPRTGSAVPVRGVGRGGAEPERGGTGAGRDRACALRRFRGGPRASGGGSRAQPPSRAAPPPRRRHGQLPRVPRGLQREAERRPALPRRRQRDLHAGPRGERALHLRGLAVRGARPAQPDGLRARPGRGVRGEDAEPQPQSVQTGRPGGSEEEEHTGRKEVLRRVPRIGCAPRASSGFHLRFCVDFLLWSVLPKAYGRASQLRGWLGSYLKSKVLAEDAQSLLQRVPVPYS